MSGTIAVKGALDTYGQGCGVVTSCGSGSGGKSTLSLLLGGAQCGCGGASKVYDQVVPPTSLTIATVGSAGQNFIDLEPVAALSEIEFLYLESSAAVVVRIDAAPATVTGVGGTFPTGFVGAETLNLEFDGTAVAVVFEAGDSTAAQVAARINSACALADVPTPRATVATSGQLTLTGILTGAQGSVEVVSGTGAATLGLTVGVTAGTGEDITVQGLFLIEPSRSAPITAVQISGQATLTVVAAGQGA